MYGAIDKTTENIPGMLIVLNVDSEWNFSKDLFSSKNFQYLSHSHCGGTVA